MNTSELIVHTAKRNNLSIENVKIVVDCFLAEMKNVLDAYGEIKIKNFVNITKAVKPERTIYNPIRKEKMTLPAKKVLKFKVSKKFLERLDGAQG